MEISISDLIKLAVPILLAWNVWLHKMVIKSQLDIAVNTTKDEKIFDEIRELKADIKAIQKMLMEK